MWPARLLDDNSAMPTAPDRGEAASALCSPSLPPSGSDSSKPLNTRPSDSFAPFTANAPSAVRTSRPVVILCTRKCQFGASSLGGIKKVRTSTSGHGFMLLANTDTPSKVSIVESPLCALRCFQISPPSSDRASDDSGTNCSSSWYPVDTEYAKAELYANLPYFAFEFLIA